MDSEKLKQLQIQPEAKRRSNTSTWAIFVLVFLCSATAAFFAWPREGDNQRVASGAKDGKPTTATSAAKKAAPSPAPPASAASPGTSVLTISGYIIARERIELSPRFMGVVRWIGVKKGDAVKKDQVVVRLDDAETKARLAEAEARIISAQSAVATAKLAVPENEARLAQAEAHLENARASAAQGDLDLQRAEVLVRSSTEPRRVLDDARLRLDALRATVREAEAALNAARLGPAAARARVLAAEAGVREGEAARAVAQLYLDWTVIRSPIDGVVLEKLVDPDELVVPQSFGGARGPSTALIALADLQDLQVEIDLNESHLAKISLRQKCRVSPEAYPDRHYDGFVAEIAPEASRQKGTLQIKVQVLKPDRFLTPELSAKVEFLAADAPPPQR
ncbi:MAG: hypothetical protein RL514_4477 [Verrucomicrobiota bacterium]|jgi:HlyD family secretion protein